MTNTSSDTTRTTEWWRDAVLYEIYVRSFQDSDGDGVGDLAGVRARLDYVRDLGVDGIWLTPFFPSPGVDNGYDVSDYVGVDPQLGTLDDFDDLVRDAHARGLRVVIDVVPNHTSIAHPWFREQPEYYVWADEPNNWLSVFGGPAWTRDDERGRYYLHLFASEQPDLDWRNPEVPREFDVILRFWLDRGVDGIRIDVAHGLYKDPELRDEAEPVPGAEPRSFDRRAATDQPEVHALYREWRSLADAYPRDRVLVGEVFLTDPARVASYVRPDELHLAFNFTLLWEPWDAEAIRAAIDASRAALEPIGATATWVLENHDVPRVVTRYGSLGRARAATLLLLALPGTVFLYAGQELGLEEVGLAPEHRRDPVFHRTDGERLGRDGARVPIPWSHEAPNFGFTTGEPWLPIPAAWTDKSIQAQAADQSSMLALVHQAIAARPSGGFAWRPTPPGSLAWERDGLACVVNLDAPPLDLPPGEVVLASDALDDGRLPTDTAAWVRP